jgi:hypothetical protein
VDVLQKCACGGGGEYLIVTVEETQVCAEEQWRDRFVTLCPIYGQGWRGARSVVLCAGSVAGCGMK